jgi:hypothetical protein
MSDHYLDSFECDHTEQRILDLNNTKIMRKFYELHPNLLSSMVFVKAVELSDLDMLSWLNQKECHLTFASWDAAKKKGDPSILQWLQKNGCPMKPSETEEIVFDMEELARSFDSDDEESIWDPDYDELMNSDDE